MGQMIVRAIPDDMLAKFKERAKQEGMSAEAMVRRLIVKEAMTTRRRMSYEEALKRMDELRAMTPKGVDIDTTALIREGRDCGYDGSDM